MRKFLIYLKRLAFGPLTAAFIIAAGWLWYHYPHRPAGNFILVIFFVWLATLFAYKIFKGLYSWLVTRFERHQFWGDEFLYFLDELFFLASLYFLVFFSRNELFSLIYFAAVSSLIFFRLDAFLGRHPAPGWRRAGRAFFILTAFIFIVSAFFQYFAYSYYILDSNIKFYNIVLFRSVSLAAFWLGGFSLASLLFLALAGRTRYAFLIVWVALFVVSVSVGAVNVGVLYHSSLYLNPVVLENAGGGGYRVFLVSTILLAGFFLAVSTAALIIISGFFKTHRLTGDKHYWYYYDLLIITLSLMVVIFTASLRNTPEAMIIKSFYDYWRGAKVNIQLAPVVQKKLERFGIMSDADKFYVNSREKIFTDGRKLLPDIFSVKKPNVVIIFLESFSSRLTGVYNPAMKEVTPGLESMAADPATSIFKNVFNPSTPTVTGLMGELCSFLPPTGHNEIEQEKHLQNHHLYCLPEAMNVNGYKSDLYITAVDKEFANKNTILASMGVKENWGTKELSRRISGEPLSWGYSDHQMFPVLSDEMKIRRLNGEEPFLLMLSTVDTHPPFNLAKDMINYGDGQNALLNAIHTTDDAFRIFWDKFKTSEFYNDTIVIAIADHAVFPSAYEKKFFPDLAGRMNFYDEIIFQMYIPGNILPKEVSVYASALDFAPTMAQLLGINGPNTFEGHSIFDDREKYPNLLGMHEFGLWINQQTGTSSRRIDYAVPADLKCSAADIGSDPAAPLTLCEYYNYFEWKRLMFEQGRLWFPAS